MHIKMIDDFIEPVRRESEQEDKIFGAGATERMFRISGYEDRCAGTEAMPLDRLLSHTRNR
jgi:hypothetical protein